MTFPALPRSKNVRASPGNVVERQGARRIGNEKSANRTSGKEYPLGAGAIGGLGVLRSSDRPDASYLNRML